MSASEDEQESSPRDTGKPHPALIDLERSGWIRGSVLDIGCCSGENALYLASKGYTVTGIDSSPTFIARALLKAARRNLKVKFLLFDSLQLEHLGMSFDTIIDCGLFHSFPLKTRPIFLSSLHRVLRTGGFYHVLCYDEGDLGYFDPKRMTKDEIHHYFTEGWEVKEITRIRFEINDSKGEYWGLLASILRLP